MEIEPGHLKYDALLHTKGYITGGWGKKVST